ncbi:MAG: GTP-binding protein [Candidatus Helarchaeota archaeon]|nr:GTP-binding protein [Candidatus Helarchaeota archaeon]
MSVDYKWKIIVLGEPAVGKTTLMLRYTEKKFRELYIPTVGCQVSKKELAFDGGSDENKTNVELYVWDIAGQSKFMKVRKVFFEGAHGFFLVYDITSEDSFNKTAKWFKDLKKSRPFKKEFTGILIGNKIDLQDQREVPRKDGIKLAKEMNVDFEETSAKTGENINEIFERIARTILNKVGE